VIRLLKKPYLLRFKGWDIFAHTVFIAILFSMISALSYHHDFDQGLSRTILYICSFGLVVAMVSYFPLRMMYRIIQQSMLIYAIIITLLITGVTSFMFTATIAKYGDRLSFIPGISKWLPEQSTNAAYMIALMVVLGYCIVMQVAVSSRRERLARRKNLSNRMKALQARIRPHFFFNTLNSVASLIRSDPDSAEKAIEDLADVFRVVIKSDRKLVSLAEEVMIAKQYMNIEKLRLGERLDVEWHTTEDAMNASIPSLTLQPLLENAVYHGIEPNLRGGTITIDCSCEEDRLHILISNPIAEIHQKRESGNKIALKNIKERLKRQFDGDVRINIRNTLERFNVAIDTPLVHSRSQR
jgi:two-component system, LytTR family, sensor histidine kinase AlgZ